MQSKYVCWPVRMQYACISNVCIFNEQKFVGCQYEWWNGIVCSHLKWNVAVLHDACTFEQFQMFWRTQYFPNYFDVSFSLFRLQFVRSFVWCLNSRFHYSTKVQLVLGNLCEYVWVCSKRFDRRILFGSFLYSFPIHFLQPSNPWCSARVNVMHLYV